MCKDKFSCHDFLDTRHNIQHYILDNAVCLVYCINVKLVIVSSVYCTWSVYTSCSLTMLEWPSHCLKAAISLWLFVSILTQIIEPSNIKRDVTRYSVKYSQTLNTKLILRCRSITSLLTCGSQSWLHIHGHFACVGISCTQRNYPHLGVVLEDTAHSDGKTVIPKQRRDDVSKMNC